ncbi:hypothetical protein [Rudanella lutea]|uniref:hypothetical protein n=1 Tax=Rudanella lutea TaxID=451374 RepID=UPI000378AC67|nr:hypothetical protein [Rudanella lutea]
MPDRNDLLDLIGTNVEITLQVTNKNIMAPTDCDLTGRQAPLFQPWHTQPFRRQVSGRLAGLTERYALLEHAGERAILTEPTAKQTTRLKGFRPATDAVQYIPLTAILSAQKWNSQ